MGLERDLKELGENFFEDLLDDESKAEKEYRKVSKNASSIEIKNIFFAMAEDEKRHKEYIKKLLEMF